MTAVTYLLIGDARTSHQFIKKGAKNLSENYHPISLTSLVCKLIESLIKRAIMKHLPELKHLSPKKFNFISGRSTTTQLMRYLDNCLDAIVNGNVVATFYLDFAKSFDSVPHRRLLGKLILYGVTGNILPNSKLQWHRFYGRTCLKWYTARKCTWANLVHSLHQQFS